MRHIPFALVVVALVACQQGQAKEPTKPAPKEESADARCAVAVGRMGASDVVITETQRDVAVERWTVIGTASRSGVPARWRCIATRAPTVDAWFEKVTQPDPAPSVPASCTEALCIQAEKDPRGTAEAIIQTIRHDMKDAAKMVKLDPASCERRRAGLVPPVDREYIPAAKVIQGKHERAGKALAAALASYASCVACSPDSERVPHCRTMTKGLDLAAAELHKTNR